MTEATTTEPFVWQDEDGYFWYAGGHLDPEVFFDLIDADSLVNGVYTPEESESEAIRTYSVPSDVQHVWYRFDGPDPDRGIACKEGDPGAEPFTRLPTP